MATELTIYRTEKPNTLCGTWVTDENDPNRFKVFNTGTIEFATGEVTIPNDFKDEHAIILCKGTGNVTVKKGTGYAGVTDLELEITGDMQYFTLDSSRYTDIETGLITINATTTQIAVLAPRV